MELWDVTITKQSLKDYELIKAAGLSPKIIELSSLLEINPFQSPPPYEKLVGDLDGLFSRRINIRHRLVYSVNKEENLVKVLRLWTYYE